MLVSLSLQHFRNYSKKTFSFSPQITAIAGPNAAGKTNILEAIYLLATGKSFRADLDREMIQYEQEIARITAVIQQSSEENIRLELLLTVGQVMQQKTPYKRFMVDQTPKRMVDFVGILTAVVFWPQDLELITGSPSLRRRFLDMVLIQVDRNYRRQLQQYEQGIRNRNKILEAIRDGLAQRNELLYWNDLVISAGKYLTDKRRTFIDFINGHQLSDSILTGKPFFMVYDSSQISQERLDQYKEAEVASAVTLVGPHRDDFFILQPVDTKKPEQGRNLHAFGSRGEQRLAVLWLKLSQLDFIEQQNGMRPLFLLDDIFSELDQNHREVVFQVMQRQQTIITTADEYTISSMQDMEMIHLT